jgi:hypothetical protein
LFLVQTLAFESSILTITRDINNSDCGAGDTIAIMAGDDIKSIVIQDDNMGDDQDIDSKDKSGSEQPSTSTSAGKKAKARHRASVACATCRDRRIRVCFNFLYSLHCFPFSESNSRGRSFPL